MQIQTTKGTEQQALGSQQPARRSGYALGLPLMASDFFRMNPFSVMRRMTEELDRVFGEGDGRELREVVWAPTIEVLQRDGNYVVRAELPGLNAKDVKVTLTDDAIVLQGERKVDHEEKRGGVRISEHRYGRFYREIPIPDGAKAEEAHAKFENGVLEIAVPMDEERNKRREIPIESSAGAPESSAAKPQTSTGGSEKAA
jgi:HSP20 family protein